MSQRLVARKRSGSLISVGLLILFLSGLGTAARVTWRLVDWLVPFPVQRLQRPSSTIIYDRNGNVLRMFLASDGRWRFPVRQSQVSPGFLKAIVTSEDQWFHLHPGVNPVSVLRALLSNLRHGRTVSGASTIPMQIARQIEPRPRHLKSKLIEAFRALQLVRLYSREEILGTYLNLTPYGGNIEGIRAASYFYFGKSPDHLSWSEIALLTALPRSPILYDPTRNPAAAALARDRVIDQLKDRGLIDSRESRTAVTARLPGVRRNVPFQAPHFSEFLRQSFPLEREMRSSLDVDLQQRVERRVNSRALELRRDGIENVAVVVLDNRTREVLALLGSADYSDAQFDGQVNGAVARRSPGSALKPFLYALAYDQGLIVPDSILLDVPHNYSGYVPENYDGLYRGTVTASQALIQSLNVPAVQLLARTGLEEFHSLLRKAGLDTLDRKSLDYGLPLVLGSGEVRLLDLSNLYASLAEGGLHRPFRLISGSGQSQPTRLFSPEAVDLTVRSLTLLRRPDLPDSWELSTEVPTVAWKTGTSYGHRDAWALGFSDTITIGVWTGNFDGPGRRGLSGAEHAAPLLFDLFRALEPSGSRLRTAPGLSLESVAVCQVSHQLPNPYCGATTEIQTIQGKSRLSLCKVHQRIFVDAHSGLLLEGRCLEGADYSTRIVEVLPAELADWKRRRGEVAASLPERKADCNAVGSGDGPRIVSPDGNTPYILRSGIPDTDQRVALAAQAQASRELYWYQNGALVASSPPDTMRFLSLIRGQHELVVVDERGRSDRLVYRVE